MLRIADRYPGGKKVDAIYVPGLCLTHDRKRLTVLNRKCMEVASRWMGKSRRLIFSGCYGGEVMYRELELRRKLAQGMGVSEGDIYEIAGIINTKDELTQLRGVLKEIGAKSIMFISDEFHMPRLVWWAQVLIPDIEIFHISVVPTRYEYAWEPNPIRRIRSGIKPLWVLWNVLMYFATPILLRR